MRHRNATYCPSAALLHDPWDRRARRGTGDLAAWTGTATAPSALPPPGGRDGQAVSQTGRWSRGVSFRSPTRRTHSPDGERGGVMWAGCHERGDFTHAIQVGVTDDGERGDGGQTIDGPGQFSWRRDRERRRIVSGHESALQRDFVRRELAIQGRKAPLFPTADTGAVRPPPRSSLRTRCCFRRRLSHRVPNSGVLEPACAPWDRPIELPLPAAARHGGGCGRR